MRNENITTQYWLMVWSYGVVVGVCSKIKITEKESRRFDDENLTKKEVFIE